MNSKFKKNRYRTNREAMSAISVFRVKFNLEFTRQTVNFSKVYHKRFDTGLPRTGRGSQIAIHSVPFRSRQTIEEVSEYSLSKDGFTSGTC